MKYEVIFTVKFKTVVTADSEGELQDRLADVHIPEDGGSFYVPDSFQVLSYKREE